MITNKRKSSLILLSLMLVLSACGGSDTATEEVAEVVVRCLGIGIARGRARRRFLDVWTAFGALGRVRIVAHRPVMVAVWKAEVGAHAMEGPCRVELAAGHEPFGFDVRPRVLRQSAIAAVLSRAEAELLRGQRQRERAVGRDAQTI